MLTNNRFTLWRLPPGKFRLSAWCEIPGGVVYTSSVDIEVGSANIDNIELPFVPAFEMKGQIDGDFLAAPEGESKKRALRALGPNGWTSKPAEIDKDGAFTIPKVHPDRYRVALEGMPANVYVKSVSVGGREAPGGVIDVSHVPTGAAVSVTLATASGGLSGGVEGPDGPVPGVMVGLFRDEPNGLDQMRFAPAGDGGKYQFASVPAGAYKVFAFDRGDLDRWKRGEGIEWYGKGIETVEITDGNAVKDLKLAADIL